MRTIKTIKQAQKIEQNQLNVQKLLNGRLYTSEGWQSFKISDELREEIAEKVSELLGGRKVTREAIYHTLKSERPQHWGLSRIHIKGERFSYCAGQDYPAELAAIRKALK